LPQSEPEVYVYLNLFDVLVGFVISDSKTKSYLGLSLSTPMASGTLWTPRIGASSLGVYENHSNAGGGYGARD
jgi:hypothetical protein